MFFFVFFLFAESKFNFKEKLKDLEKKIGAEVKEKTKGIDIGKYLDKGIDHVVKEAKKKFNRIESKKSSRFTLD